MYYSNHTELVNWLRRIYGSQKSLAEALEVSQATISNWKKGGKLRQQRHQQKLEFLGHAMTHLPIFSDSKGKG